MISIGAGWRWLETRISVEERAERVDIMFELAGHGNGWHLGFLYSGRCRDILLLVF